MLFSLVTVLGSWCFADRRDSDIPTVKAFKKSHTFMYVHVRLYSHMVLALPGEKHLSLIESEMRLTTSSRV